MPTVIERIAAAEADAEAIRRNARENARELVAAAEDQAAVRLKNAREEAKAGLALAASMAEKEAEAESARLMEKAGAEADKLIAEAEKKLPDAANAIIESILTGI